MLLDEVIKVDNNLQNIFAFVCNTEINNLLQVGEGRGTSSAGEPAKGATIVKPPFEDRSPS